MSAKHTPGPWEIERGYSTIIKSIGPCVPDEYAGSAWLEVSEEDARLIAAAPDLLDALQYLADEFRSIVNSEFATYRNHDPAKNDPAYFKAMAAIAKAIG